MIYELNRLRCIGKSQTFYNMTDYILVLPHYIQVLQKIDLLYTLMPVYSFLTGLKIYLYITVTPKCLTIICYYDIPIA